MDKQINMCDMDFLEFWDAFPLLWFRKKNAISAEVKDDEKLRFSHVWHYFCKAYGARLYRNEFPCFWDFIDV